ncbi:hypothetical protein BMS3Abin02_01091 [bacterium BMS3Abin02]|nr:hypothetical protein BMS3Abin02_01091 [bacterium BMS3Abin02]GBE23687.1 hypothetical protein BMS3Bbin01_03073 [bacterium BMS3Bbin01]HDL49247.1 hypothetical protein [Actinomycetota bacterium]
MNPNLCILAFDHRGSFKKKMFGIIGREPNADEQAHLADANGTMSRSEAVADIAANFRHFIDVYEGASS